MLGGLGALKPKYKGSNQYEVSGFPFIDIKYKKIFFLNFREGLGINVLHAPNFRVGATFNFYGRIFISPFFYYLLDFDLQIQR